MRLTPFEDWYREFQHTLRYADPTVYKLTDSTKCRKNKYSCHCSSTKIGWKLSSSRPSNFHAKYLSNIELDLLQNYLLSTWFLWLENIWSIFTSSKWSEQNSVNCKPNFGFVNVLSNILSPSFTSVIHQI